MKCPFCGCNDTQVKDSRNADDDTAVRRRRECPECGQRFTTFEHVQLRDLTVIKKDGTRVPFERDKLEYSIKLATRKRDIPSEKISSLANTIVRELEQLGDSPWEPAKMQFITILSHGHTCYLQKTDLGDGHGSPLTTLFATL